MVRARAITGIFILFAVCAPHAFGQLRGGESYRLTLPNKNWSLDFSLPGFAVLLEEIKDGGRQYSFEAMQRPDKQNPPRFVLLTVLMEPALLKGSASDFSAYAVKTLVEMDRAKKSSLKTSTYNQIPVAAYKVVNPTFGDSPSGPTTLNFDAAAMNAFLVKDDVWITVDLTASPLKDNEKKLFYSILDSLKLTDTSSPVTSFDYYQLGRSLFLQKQYPKAIEPLAKALTLEHQQRQLGTADWRKLIEELTDALGAVGDKTRAKAVLDYGINNDPTNPHFHFGLARVQASSNDLDATIASLEKAFTNAKNDAFSRRLPDPLTDPAFGRFQKESRFRDAVKAMKKLLKD